MYNVTEYSTIKDVCDYVLKSIEGLDIPFNLIKVKYEEDNEYIGVGYIDKLYNSNKAKETKPIHCVMGNMFTVSDCTHLDNELFMFRDFINDDADSVCISNATEEAYRVAKIIGFYECSALQVLHDTLASKISANSPNSCSPAYEALKREASELYIKALKIFPTLTRKQLEHIHNQGCSSNGYNNLKKMISAL